ncbi:MAG TPA: hypothetical protein VHS36_02575, partial [Candidatus Limnocylindrales bacterium]|nr:hypothetical protein [Candidatus Limnocylindrales bacterium]
RFLRVVTLRPIAPESALDGVLRSAVVPSLLDDRRVLDVWIGRHGTRDDQARVVASTWTDEPVSASGEPIDLATLRSLGAGVAAVEDVEQAPLSVHARFERSEPTRILRVFHGQVHPGELDRYIELARTGMLADATAYGGLIAFALAARPPEAFTTVSAWTGWPAIEAATGGNTRQPFMTRNAQLLETFSVKHYEVLPDAADRSRRRP